MAKQRKGISPRLKRRKRTSDRFQVVPANVDNLFDRVVAILDAARIAVVRSVNNQMVLAYWHIGREIVHTLQGGDDRAEYGQRLIEELSKRLTAQYGRGFSSTNLRYFRNFHQVYADRIPEIRHMTCGKSDSNTTASGVLQDLALAVEDRDPMCGFSPLLGWSHYRVLMSIEHPAERFFYEIEAEKEGWSVEHLTRQIHTMLFARLLKSRDKVGVMELTREGQEIRKYCVPELLPL